MPNDTSLPADVTTLPLLPLRDVVVFPHMVIPLFVGRPKSIKALDVAMDAGKHILLVAQKQAAKDDPVAGDLYDIGSVATVLQMLKLPDGRIRILIQGLSRSRVDKVNAGGELAERFDPDLRRHVEGLYRESNELTAKLLAAHGYRVEDVEPYIENNDLQGFFVTYQKP